MSKLLSSLGKSVFKKVNNKNKKENKIELLAPAGDLNKLKIALAYGADAVYCGVPDFSLRVRINRFLPRDLKSGVAYAHKLNKKVYVTLNIYAHNWHLKKIPKHIDFLRRIKVDGIIISDPGVMNLIKRSWPEAEIHLSTQANATNYEAVKFWLSQGIKRIILAREVTLEEIVEIKKAVPTAELEYFIHGAMCMSYSGRCILSKWMTGRSANLGDCAQPCRWAYQEICNLKTETQKTRYLLAHKAEKIAKSSIKQEAQKNYKEMSVIDDQNRFEMEVEEDAHGTYFFNSYEMNLIEHLDKLIEAGVISLKIEGRAKSAYYLAVVTRAYRKVLAGLENKLSKKALGKIIAEQKEELDNLVHRGYSTGFLLGNEPAHNFTGCNNETPFEFVGEVLGKEENLNIVRVHNQIFLQDELEAITPDKNIPLKIKKILNYQKKPVISAHGGHQQYYYFEFNKILEKMTLMRSKRIPKA